MRRWPSPGQELRSISDDRETVPSWKLERQESMRTAAEHCCGIRKLRRRFAIVRCNGASSRLRKLHKAKSTDSKSKELPNSIGKPLTTLEKPRELESSGL